MNTELQRAVRLAVLAHKQSIGWDKEGSPDVAARLRILSRKHMRHARWLKSIELLNLKEAA